MNTLKSWMAIAVASAAFGQEMTLSQALGRLEAGSRAIAASGERIEAATEAKKASFANFLPVVKLEADAMRLDREIELDLDPIRTAIIQLQSGDAVAQQTLATALKGGALAPQQQAAVAQGATQKMDAALPHFVETVKERDDWSLALTAYQPIFHGGRILAGERAASSRESVAKSDLERQKGDLRRDFSKLYVQAALLRQSIRVRNEALGAIARHADRARSLVAQGMADRSALLRAELARAEAVTALSDDSAKLEGIGITLGQMAGSDGSIVPSDTLAAPPAELSDIRDFEARVRSGSPLLRSLSAQVELAHQGVAAKTADFLPEVGLFGKYEFNEDAAKMALEPVWVVGVRGTVTLFHGMGDVHGRRAAMATEREVRLVRLEAERALAAQAKRQYLALDQSRTRWRNLSAQSDLSRENHRTTEARFGEGQATGLEVVDAWLAMQKTDLERLSAAGEAWIALGEVLWAEGRSEEFVEDWNAGGRK